ncbi:alpha/beta hydrolase [Streptomyces sp. NPDC001339]|uniref:alpha/beta hydrolase n=1 Tax=Streptomyces sp. NPDC001339 TaxID=3364563 RepID=UPI0036CFBB9D
MTQPPHDGTPRVRDVVLDADGLPLSGLLAEPRHALPRAVVVALHGGGMRAGYFHGQAHPSLSLLTLGAQLGYTVLALDRPGYGASEHRLPKGMVLTDQSQRLHTALTCFAAQHPIGAGFFLLAHSYGGKLALTMAADEYGSGLIGLDVSGLGHRYAVDVEEFAGFDARRSRHLHWGPLRLYPPGTFRLAAPLVTPMPEREVHEAPRWPAVFPGVAARARVPMRFTFAEYERWWRHDDATVSAMRRLLAAPMTVVDRLPHAGHNVSLGWAARSYHLRALGFLEECLLAHEWRQKSLSPGAA